VLRRPVSFHIVLLVWRWNGADPHFTHLTRGPS
jgi:hypothetical protein